MTSVIVELGFATRIGARVLVKPQANSLEVLEMTDTAAVREAMGGAALTAENLRQRIASLSGFDASLAEFMAMMAEHGRNVRNDTDPGVIIRVTAVE